MRGWLASVVQAAKPWMSESEIDKGTRSLTELSHALADIRVGIVCLTPENLTKPWLLFEAGALSKNIDERARLCTYLIGDLQSSDVLSPLGMFQDTKTTKGDTLRMVRTINRVVSDEPIAEETLVEVFDAMWPKLQDCLNSLPEPSEGTHAKRPQDEILTELLDLARAQANFRDRTQFLDAYIPMYQQLLPLLQQIILNANRAALNVPPSPLIHPRDTSLDRSPFLGFLNTIGLPNGLQSLTPNDPAMRCRLVRLVQMLAQPISTPDGKGKGVTVQFTIKGLGNAGTEETHDLQLAFDIESATRLVAYIEQTIKTATWRPN
jgi:hypothetical protein